jgi:hypothetical protein
MPQRRSNAAVVDLSDGSLLIVGGVYRPLDDNLSLSTALSSVAKYNAGTGLWTAAAPMETPRWMASAVRLPNGKVLVAAGATEGYRPPYTSSCELYDPATDTWSAVASIPGGPRVSPEMVVLADGKVLLFGGYPGMK